jgi:hypothetical protein
MPFEPDIIVTSREAPDVGLVVEAKLDVPDLPAVEQQLKRYMFGMRCPVGLLVTPDFVRVYRDTYREHGVASIDLVGEFPSPKSLSEGPVSRAHVSRATPGVSHADVVQEWLEQLAQGSNLSELSRPLREAMEQHVLPILAQGEVRAGGPRWRRTGS